MSTQFNPSPKTSNRSYPQMNHNRYNGQQNRHNNHQQNMQQDNYNPHLHAPQNDVSNRTQQSERGGNKKFMNIKSHGKSNAIEVAPCQTTKDWFTINIEGAPKLNGNTKAYDWKQKVTIQITKTELPVVIGCLLGYLPSCEYRNHGGEAGKWFSIINQGANFYFKVGQVSTKQMMPCPVPTVEAHLMGMLALSQYAKNFDGLTTDAALEAIRVMCSHMVKNNSFPAASARK